MHAFRLVFGIFSIAVVACGAASSPSNGSDTNNPETKPDGKSPNGDSTAKADGGWENGCSPAVPIRWYVNNTDHGNPEPLHDACEALPDSCAPDAAITDPRTMDTQSTCDCVLAVKNAKNDAGLTACPGNGPIYCDVAEDHSLVVRCSPP